MPVLTTEGREWIIDKLQDVAPITNARMQAIWWGTGATAEAVGNTFASVTEAAEARVSGTLTQPTATTDRCVGTITATSNKNITESGRTNTTTKGAAGQVLFMRALFTAVPVEVGDAIQFTHDYIQG